MKTSALNIQRIALIGAGYFSQFHLQGWAAMKDIEIVALCDSDIAKATALAERFDIRNICTDLNQLLTDYNFDLVDIVTPPASHETLINLALQHNKAIICQKPFASNYTQARALTELAEQANVPVVIHENFRFMPWFVEIHRLLNEGLLGALHHVNFRLRTGDGQGPAAYLERQPYFQKLPRFLVMETAVHLIDTFRYLCGEVKAVYAHLRRLNPVMAGEDAAFIHFEFEGACTGHFDGNRLNDHSSDNTRRTFGELWLEGERGVIRLDGHANLFLKPHQQAEQQLIYDKGTDNQFGNGACGALQQHVVAALRNGTPPANSARSYLRNLVIQEAVYASHEQDRRIAIDSFTPPLIPLTPFA